MALGAFRIRYIVNMLVHIDLKKPIPTPGIQINGFNFSVYNYVPHFIHMERGTTLDSSDILAFEL